MKEYKAIFEVESKTDAYAVERSLERLYVSLREESRSVREASGDSAEMLAQFAEIRDAARNLRPGPLTVVYEQWDEEFEWVSRSGDEARPIRMSFRLFEADSRSFVVDRDRQNA